MMSNLHVFFNDTDWVVAADVQDAIAVWEEAVGDTWADYGDADDWRQLGPDDELRIWYEETDFNPDEQPEGAKIVKRDHRIAAICTAAAWAAHNGRGFLCSTEW